MARNWTPSLTNSQQGTGILSVTACKELSPANNHLSLEGDPSPVEPSDEIPAPVDTLLQLHEILEADGPYKQYPDT